MTRPAPGGDDAAAHAPAPGPASAAKPTGTGPPLSPLEQARTRLAALPGVHIVERPLTHIPEVLAFVMHGLECFELVAAGPLVAVRRFERDRTWRVLAECGGLTGALAVLAAHVEARLAARDALAAAGLPHGAHGPTE